MISKLITFFKGFVLILATVIVYFALVELRIIIADYIRLRKNALFKDIIIGKTLHFICNLTTASGFYFNDINIFIKRKNEQESKGDE